MDPQADLCFIKARINETPMLSGLPEPALDQLARGVRIQTFEKDAVICERESPGNEFFIVLEGVVNVFVPTDPSVSERPLNMKLMAGSSEAVVRLVKRGECFGEIACLEPEGTRTANAKTPFGCKLIIVPRNVFLELLREPGFALSILQHLAKRVRWHADHLASLQRPADRAASDQASRTWWERFADFATKKSAAWGFMAFHLVWWIYWFSNLNHSMPITKWPMTVDLLTNIVSLEAIVLAIFILVAQRRKEQRDESRAEIQYNWASVTVERTRVLLSQLVSLNAELDYYRAKDEIRQRSQTPPPAPPNPQP